MILHLPFKSQIVSHIVASQLIDLTMYECMADFIFFQILITDGKELLL